MIARVGYRSGTRYCERRRPRFHVYWPSGVTCARKLTTRSTRGGVTLDPGAGVIEFQCLYTDYPGSIGIWTLAIAVQHEDDLQQRCATLPRRKREGSLMGNFLIENNWKIGGALIRRGKDPHG